MRRAGVALGLILLAVHGSGLAQDGPTGARIVNAASYEESRPLAPGSLASAFGSFEGASAANTKVLVDNVPGTVTSVFETQINFRVPLDVGAGPYTRSAKVRVLVNGAVRAEGGTTIRDASPALFLSDASASARPAVAVNGNGTLNSEGNPAGPGTVIQLFLTGSGADPSVANPVVFFRTRAGETVYSGLPIPGEPGLWRIDVRVPEIPGALRGQVPIVVSFDGLASNTASVWIE